MTAHILISLLCRGIQVLCGLLVVKNLINILGVDTYGVWVTMTSIVAWMTLFDFGVGYGLKNKISEAVARENNDEVSYWVSVIIKCYIVIALVLFCLFGTFAFISLPFKNYPFVSVVLVTCAALSFFFSTGSIILQALGHFKQLYTLGLIYPVFWLLATASHYWFSYSINQIVLIYAFFIIMQGWFIFYISIGSGRSILGSLKNKINYSVLRGILATGVNFFLLQICSLGLFMTGNYICYHFFGGSDVAVFDTINKIFQLFSVGFSIFISVFWTEISKAKAGNNRAKKLLCFRVLMALSFISTITALIFAYNIDVITSIISGGKIIASYDEALPFACLVSVQSFAYSGAVFMNAYEKLKVQVYLAVISLPLFFFIVSIMIKMHHGFSSIPLASAIAIVPSMLACLFFGYRLAKL